MNSLDECIAGKSRLTLADLPAAEPIPPDLTARHWLRQLKARYLSANMRPSLEDAAAASCAFITNIVTCMDPDVIDGQRHPEAALKTRTVLEAHPRMQLLVVEFLRILASTPDVDEPTADDEEAAG